MYIYSAVNSGIAREILSKSEVEIGGGGGTIIVYISNRHKNCQCVALRLSIHLPENAKKSILETLELKYFLGEHAPKPP